MLPYYNENKEYESPDIHKVRVSLGMTINDLAISAKIGTTAIYRLADGRDSPLYLGGSKMGTAKPGAMRLADALNTDFNDLFPRYVCKLQAAQLTDDQMLAAAHGYVSVYKTPQMEEAFWEVVSKHLSTRTFDIVRSYLTGYSMAELGERYQISITRVRDIILGAYGPLNGRMS